MGMLCNLNEYVFDYLFDIVYKFLVFVSLCFRMPPVNTTTTRRSSRIRKRGVSARPARDNVPSRNHGDMAQGTNSSIVTNNNSLQQQVQNLTETVLNMQQQLVTVSSLLHQSTRSVPQDDSNFPTASQSHNMTVHFQQAGIIPDPLFSDSTAISTATVTETNSTGMQMLNVMPLNLDRSSDAPNTNTIQQALPLGALVSDTVKNKIWANDYIELASLLPNETVSRPSALPIVVEGVGNERHLGLQQTPKQIKTMDQRVSAFSIYMAVYCEKFQNLFPHLVKYMDIIRNMARQKGNWKQYDIEFRQSKCQLTVTWGNMHHSLWLQYMVTDKNDSEQNAHSTHHPSNTHNNVQNAQKIPYGYCIRFHQGFYCQTPCIYNDKCYICNLYHPAVKCWYIQGVMSPGSQSAMRGAPGPSAVNNARMSFRPPSGQQFVRGQQPTQRLPRPPFRRQSPFRYSRR